MTDSRGGAVTFVIRKSTIRHGAYNVIDECYVQSVGENEDEAEGISSTMRIH